MYVGTGRLIDIHKGYIVSRPLLVTTQHKAIDKRERHGSVQASWSKAANFSKNVEQPDLYYRLSLS